MRSSAARTPSRAIVEHRHQAVAQRLDDWPPLSSTRALIWPTVCVTTVVASVLPRVSYSEVLPRRSANRTVR
jgi:hypothetical protein